MSDTLKSALRYGEQCKRLVNARLENANEQITAALFDEITRLRAELADCRALLAVYGDRAEELRESCEEKQRCIDSSVQAQRTFLAEIDRLRAELAEWKQEWQTMETAPKDGSRILLATPSGKIADGFWSLEYRVWSWPYVMVEPTHWTRSLPIPGRKGEGEVC